MNWNCHQQHFMNNDKSLTERDKFQRSESEAVKRKDYIPDDILCIWWEVG